MMISREQQPYFRLVNSCNLFRSILCISMHICSTYDLLSYQRSSQADLEPLKHTSEIGIPIRRWVGIQRTGSKPLRNVRNPPVKNTDGLYMFRLPSILEKKQSWGMVYRWLTNFIYIYIYNFFGWFTSSIFRFTFLIWWYPYMGVPQ